MTTQEMIAVMQAFADGKKLECRFVDGDKWVPASSPIWAWDRYEYRVKPEPREWWIVNGKQYTALFGTKNEAESSVFNGPAEIIHVREVLE